jgi:hypothetical protein
MGRGCAARASTRPARCATGHDRAASRRWRQPRWTTGPAGLGCISTNAGRGRTWQRPGGTAPSRSSSSLTVKPIASTATAPVVVAPLDDALAAFDRDHGDITPDERAADDAAILNLAAELASYDDGRDPVVSKLREIAARRRSKPSTRRPPMMRPRTLRARRYAGRQAPRRAATTTTLALATAGPEPPGPSPCRGALARAGGRR